MPVTLCPVFSFTSCFLISDVSVFTISIASCDTGNTHWSGWVVRRTPSFSNHKHVSWLPNSFSSRFISLAPLGYTESMLLTSLKLLVRLHRPPPVIATLARGFLPPSNTVTFVCGKRRFISIAVKHPAAPAPIMAMFMLWVLKKCRKEIGDSHGGIEKCRRRS